MKQVDIVIPTLLHKPDLLVSCLQSLSKMSTSVSFHVWVIANTTQMQLDFFLDEYKEELPTLKHISWYAMGKNTGFTGAVNTGARLGTSPYIVLLNDDTTVTSTWLEKLVKTQQETKAEMVASKIVLASDASQIDSLGFTFLWRGKAMAMTETKVAIEIINQKDYWLHHPELLTIQGSHDLSEPFGPDAAAALYTRDLWLKLDGMNDSFFAYLEDVDFALRARLLGARCSLAKDAVVNHHKHATSKGFSGFKSRQDMINWLRIVSQTYPSSAWKKFGLRIVIERIKNGKGFVSSFLQK